MILIKNIQFRFLRINIVILESHKLQLRILRYIQFILIRQYKSKLIDFYMTFKFYE